MPQPVLIVPYDPAWPEAFRAERALLAAALGSDRFRFEHIGSTAVPGLGAKPVLDILLGAPALSEIDAAIGRIEALGYVYVPEYEREIPDRRFFRKDMNGLRTHHVHAVETDGDFWRKHLLFRDHLRSHPEAAEAYHRLKRDLARRFRNDRDAYTDGKTQFIREALEAARAERAGEREV
jgi:GrpB-like predicted nucleotidyltransferase (UPF0157 family)